MDERPFPGPDPGYGNGFREFFEDTTFPLIFKPGKKAGVATTPAFLKSTTHRLIRVMDSPFRVGRSYKSVGLTAPP